MTNPTPEQEQEAISELLRVIAAYREWVAAVPREIELPAMPGIDLDWVNDSVYAAQQASAQLSALRKSHAELLEALKDADDLIRNLVEYQGAKLSAAGESRQEHYASVIQFAKELQA